MGVRDLYFWATEARRKMTLRRIEQCNAALLPYQRPDKIKAYSDGLNQALEEIELGGPEAVAKAEKDNEALIEQNKARAKEVIARRKAAGKPLKKRRLPKNARRIR